MAKKINFNNNVKRMGVLRHYSNGRMRCKRCGCDNIHLLTIDHIENDGAKHRKELGYTNIHRWLMVNNYPDGYQVLCRNCNYLKHVYYGNQYEKYRKMYNIKTENFYNIEKIDFPYYNIPDKLLKD